MTVNTIFTIVTDSNSLRESCNTAAKKPSILLRWTSQIIFNRGDFACVVKTELESFLAQSCCSTIACPLLAFYDEPSHRGAWN